MLDKNPRKLIIECSKRANVGHIGSALSIIDILYVLYKDVLNIDEQANSIERDRFVLSKGHAALALYVVLYLKKLISQKDLESYCMNNSQFAAHPKHHIKGIDFSTGSLGQGVTFAVGCALASKVKKINNKIYCLLSDAELNEGSFWEAILFAAHNKLSNLIFILDNNGQQALAPTEEVIKVIDLKTKIASFGFNSYEIDGHDIRKIKDCFTNIENNNKPHFIIANTICGKGVSYMEKTIEWHYKSMDDVQYEQAILEMRKNA